MPASGSRISLTQPGQARTTPSPMPNGKVDPSTPPRQYAGPSKDVRHGCPTKVRIPPSQEASLYYSTLNAMRISTAEHAGPAMRLELDEFLEYALPQTLTKEQVQSVVDRTNTQVKKLIIEGRADRRAVEERFFQHFELIIQEVSSIGSEVLKIKPTGRVSYHPRDQPGSSERNNSTKPDCNILLNKSESSAEPQLAGNILFCDTIATFEFKKYHNDRDLYSVSPVSLHFNMIIEVLTERPKNRVQLVWNLRHILRDDPCRRFVFGITIEDYQMRIWLACRVGIFVSRSFDYTKRTDILLNVLVRLMFSEKTELGWDDSMERTPDRKYRIRVGDEEFVTESVLCNISAEEIEGRATRVWKARDKDGKLVVLKDTWLDETRTPEDVMLKGILETESNEEMISIVKRALFTVVCSGRVVIDGKEDNTKGILHGLGLQTRPPGLRITAPEDVKVQQGLHGGPGIGPSSKPVTSVVIAQRNKLFHRYHYRIVFKEVATPLYNVNSLAQIFTACYDTVMVIAYLATRGYVHRDISNGNVYIHESKPGEFEGKLSDMEYMKKLGAERRCDIRTGTAGCWAVEVELEEYIFYTAKTGAPREAANFIAEFSSRLNDSPLAATAAGDSPVEKVFYHNPLHDIESLWWICVGKLFRHQVITTIIEEGEIKEVELVKKEDFRRQWQVASQIFPSAESNRKRVHFLKYDSVFRDCMSTLSPQLAGISDLLRQIREQLISCYTLAEASYPHISEDAFKIEKLTAFSRLFAKAFMEAKQFTLRDFPDEWIREYFKSLEDESPSNAEQRSTTSVKRELDDPFVDGRTSKSQKLDDSAPEAVPIPKVSEIERKPSRTPELTE